MKESSVARGDVASGSTDAPSRPVLQRDPYEAHPLLDPDFARNRRGLARLWFEEYRAIRDDPGAESQLVARILASGEASLRPYQKPEAYLLDTDTYLEDLLRHVPDSASHELRPRPEIRDMNRLNELLLTCFESSNPRIRYEAQRKLGLAKLLFEIDHCRRVRDGQRHKELFEALLDRELLAGAASSRMVEICCRFVEDENGHGRFDVDVAPSPDARCWRFQPVRLQGSAADREVEVYHYRCRFKRDASPMAPVCAEDGAFELSQAREGSGSKTRSGSILSKMIRQAVADPHFVQDLLGAQFIVGDRKQAYDLERRLLRLLGGPARFRDRVDTLIDGRERHRLTKRSAPNFHVLKETVDLLVEDPAAPTPYLFSIEIQIYPLEAYLETIHDAHYSSHAAFKKRQFLLDVLPVLFPPSIYGYREDVFQAWTR